MKIKKSEAMTKRPADHSWVRWHDVARALYLTGHIDRLDGKGASFKIAKLLKEGVAAGRVVHKKEGHNSFWAIDPRHVHTDEKGRTYVAPPKGKSKKPV